MNKTIIAFLALSSASHVSADDLFQPRADSHAPIGVMGDHLHQKGELMLSYRFMRMEMGGSRVGTNEVTPEQIVTNTPNQFFGRPGQPPNLRVVPVTMDMEMHMLGAMYGVSDDVTLMVMGMYGTRSMDHVTFQGGVGTTRLGEFTTKSSDFGDTKLAALVRLFDDGHHKLHFNGGISVPTGSISEEDEILTPMGGRPNVRLPYPMQLGSGTWDLEPGITYSGHSGNWGWGGQGKATLRLGDNSANYTLGDRYEGTMWMSYLVDESLSLSARVKGATQGTIDGQDQRIVAPVQTAQTSFQGGDRIDVLGGVNYLFTGGALNGHRLAIEAGVPIYQNLNGPQLETDFTLTVGWQKVF